MRIIVGTIFSLMIVDQVWLKVYSFCFYLLLFSSLTLVISILALLSNSVPFSNFLSVFSENYFLCGLLKALLLHRITKSIWPNPTIFNFSRSSRTIYNWVAAVKSDSSRKMSCKETMGLGLKGLREPHGYKGVAESFGNDWNVDDCSSPRPLQLLSVIWTVQSIV